MVFVSASKFRRTSDCHSWIEKGMLFKSYCENSNICTIFMLKYQIKNIKL